MVSGWSKGGEGRSQTIFWSFPPNTIWFFCCLIKDRNVDNLSISQTITFVTLQKRNSIGSDFRINFHFTDDVGILVGYYNVYKMTIFVLYLPKMGMPFNTIQRITNRPLYGVISFKNNFTSEIATWVVNIGKIWASLLHLICHDPFTDVYGCFKLNTL